ncbi:homoserine kinase [Sporichthya polymorpha]|uniref:homoserine kinase n=1 Tax=Sporichthya polymorpha TaxID=35751 RepID=UPI00035F730A|nr:homoserine kinase [Sporichthya polymorpha]
MSQQLSPPTYRSEAVRVRVPASSANLGPGFDCFGLALTLHDVVEAQVQPEGLALSVEGEGAHTVNRDGRHLVVRSMNECFARLGGPPPGLRVACRNAIPHGRGMGSSSAAIVAGVVAARALCVDGEQRMDDAALLRLATELEGHPDNVAAALAGGFTLAWTEADGPHLIRLEASPEVSPVVFVPSTELSTRKARGLLPRTVPHADAAANAGRAALLVEALTRNPELLLVATEDRLHQNYRGPAMPASLELIQRLRADGVPATVSGAGPSVLALATRDTVEKVAGLAGEGWRVHRLSVDPAGATVLS